MANEEGAKTKIGMNTSWSTSVVVAFVGVIVTNLAALYVIPSHVLDEGDKRYVRKDVNEQQSIAQTTLLNERMRVMSEQLGEIKVQVRLQGDKLESVQRSVSSNGGPR